MTPSNGGDPLDRVLCRLPVAAPDPVRAARTRRRCHLAMKRVRLSHLGEAHRRPARAPERRGFVRRVLEPAAVAGFSLVYLSGIILDVLRVRGVL
jgi:hypothetical protein